jgi:hypothetical protein
VSINAFGRMSVSLGLFNFTVFDVNIPLYDQNEVHLRIPEPS